MLLKMVVLSFALLLLLVCFLELDLLQIRFFFFFTFLKKLVPNIKGSEIVGIPKNSRVKGILPIYRYDSIERHSIYLNKTNTTNSKHSDIDVLNIVISCLEI